MISRDSSDGRPVVRIQLADEPDRGSASRDRWAVTPDLRGPGEGGRGQRTPLRLTRLMLTLLLLLALGAGVGISELGRQQDDRARADRQGSELTLAALQLEREIDAERVVLRVQVQNRGPAPVRLVEVVVAGSPLRSDPGDLIGDSPLPAGGDRTVSIQAPTGCTDGGATLSVPGAPLLTVVAETSRGGRRSVDVRLASVPSLDDLGETSPSSLDRVCGVVPPGEALQSYGLHGPDEPTPPAGTDTFTVAFENVSRVPQRLLSLKTDLGDATLVHEGAPISLPTTIPAGEATTGVTLLGGTASFGSFTYLLTVQVTCRPQAVRPLVGFSFSFDAGPGTPLQQMTFGDGSSRC